MWPQGRVPKVSEVAVMLSDNRWEDSAGILFDCANNTMFDEMQETAQDLIFPKRIIKLLCAVILPPIAWTQTLDMLSFVPVNATQLVHHTPTQSSLLKRYSHCLSSCCFWHCLLSAWSFVWSWDVFIYILYYTRLKLINFPPLRQAFTTIWNSQ